MGLLLTRKPLTKEELEEKNKRIKKEIEYEVALLDAPELTKEEKELVVGIRRGLRDAKEGKGYTMEEVREMLFGENGLCR